MLQDSSSPERIRAFEEVAQMFGNSGNLPRIQSGRNPTAIRVVGGRDGLGPLPAPLHSGGFQHLKVSYDAVYMEGVMGIT